MKIRDSERQGHLIPTDCFTENVGTYGLNVAILTAITSAYDCIQQCQSNLRCMVWTFSQSK